MCGGEVCSAFGGGGGVGNKLTLISVPKLDIKLYLNCDNYSYS